ncbi:hypothetical protein TcCL_NonESM12817 [Trypanosoma cruzi]|nr:hypothetical protein TcCL_NonESM12817 [Trypanosoma cruzi]
MLKRLMGCLPFFLRPVVSLVWSWRQQWASATACSSHLSHLPLLLPCCVGGEEAGDCVGEVASQWEREGPDRTIDVDPCPPCMGVTTVPFSFVLLCAVCAYDAAACCAMLACASKKRRLDCWRPAISPPLFRAIITTFLDVLVDCRLQRRYLVLSRPLCVLHGIRTALW